MDSKAIVALLIVSIVNATPSAAQAPPAKDVIVMAMHGGPAHDFPPEEMAELFSFDCLKNGLADDALDSLERRHQALEEKMKRWPRNADNDAYFTGSQTLAEALSRATGLAVIACFNDYCAPDVPSGIDSAVALGATRVIVVTPMMTPGGGHSEQDIPSSIKAAQGSYPQIPIVYAWPFDVEPIAAFLAGHMEKFVSEGVSER